MVCVLWIVLCVTCCESGVYVCLCLCFWSVLCGVCTLICSAPGVLVLCVVCMLCVLCCVCYVCCVCCVFALCDMLCVKCGVYVVCVSCVFCSGDVYCFVFVMGRHICSVLFVFYDVCIVCCLIAMCVLFLFVRVLQVVCIACCMCRVFVGFVFM